MNPRPMVRIDMACNDPDDGSFAGRVEMIALPQQMLELTARRHPAPKLVELPGVIRLSGKRWPSPASTHWVGNWCWNGYWMALPDAVAFLNWLRSGGRFHLDGGWCEACDAWDAPGALDMQALKGWLWEASRPRGNATEKGSQARPASDGEGISEGDMPTEPLPARPEQGRGGGG